MRRHEQARLFLRKAAEDEALVAVVLVSRRVTSAIVGFHCQQAAEKLLKAVLSEFSIPFRRTHDLRELMDALADAGYPLPKPLASLDALTPYATLLRYEGIPAKASLNRRRTLEKVRRLRAWAKARVEGEKGLF